VEKAVVDTTAHVMKSRPGRNTGQVYLGKYLFYLIICTFSSAAP
jgi:hypothetical protein